MAPRLSLALVLLASCATPPAPEPKTVAPARDPAAADRAFERARGLASQGDHAGAIPIFDEALRADGENAMIMIEAAASHLLADTDLSAADRLLEKALTLEPNNPRAHFLFAETRYRAGDLKAAEAHFTQAIALRPEMAEARIRLAEHFEATGRLEQAAKELEAAEKSTPDDARIGPRRAALYEKLGRFAEAAACLEASARKLGRSAVLFRQAARLYESAKMPAKVKEMIALADQLDPPPVQKPKRQLPKSRVEGR